MKEIEKTNLVAKATKDYDNVFVLKLRKALKSNVKITITKRFRSYENCSDISDNFQTAHFS
jgi:hypothetical protein